LQQQLEESMQSIPNYDDANRVLRVPKAVYLEILKADGNGQGEKVFAWGDNYLYHVCPLPSFGLQHEGTEQQIHAVAIMWTRTLFVEGEAATQVDLLDQMVRNEEELQFRRRRSLLSLRVAKQFLDHAHSKQDRIYQLEVKAELELSLVERTSIVPLAIKMQQRFWDLLPAEMPTRFREVNKAA
jgi:hypothetical protein